MKMPDPEAGANLRSPTNMKMPPPATAAAKRRLSSGTRPRKRARVGSGEADLISDLPGDILRAIVSLLPTKEGARTQAIAHRWRPLWRATLLNIDGSSLEARYPPCRRGARLRTSSMISQILSDHPGPIQRFDFRLPSISKTKKRYDEDVAHFESWLGSGRLENLHELHIVFPFFCPPSDNHPKLYQLPSSVLRSASTIVAATIGFCNFPDEIAPSLSFPVLKHLTLLRVSISEVIFHGVLSACHVLETLLLDENDCIDVLYISSPTIRSIGFKNCYIGDAELIIEDTPCLERLLCINSCVDNIRVNRAPKLEILGPLLPGRSSIQIENLNFQGLITTSLDHSICTVKILSLKFPCTDLARVLDILRFFPCLEMLYIMSCVLFQWSKYVSPNMENVCPYDPPYPINCLETRLKKLVLKNYKGDMKDVSFAKFFVSNAKVLNEIKFGLNEKIDKKWVANQHKMLGVETKASPVAGFKFIRVSSFNVELDTHDLSIANPFNNLFSKRD